MPLDLRKLFVVHTISRAQVAAELNDQLQNCSDEDHFASDDDRLTDDICTLYAEALGNLAETEPDFEENYAAMVSNLLSEIARRGQPH